jgi:hypothetical protein
MGTLTKSSMVNTKVTFLKYLPTFPQEISEAMCLSRGSGGSDNSHLKNSLVCVALIYVGFRECTSKE